MLFNKEILLDKDYRELKREYQKKLDVELNELKKFKSEFLSKAGAKLNSLYQEKKELISDRKGLIVTKEEYKDAKANIELLKQEIKFLELNFKFLSIDTIEDEVSEISEKLN